MAGLTSDPKLPFKIGSVYPHIGAWELLDGCDQPVELTKHRAELIVAALTADAEKEVGGG